MTELTIQEYYKDFPEAPASDTSKWIDKNGFVHMTTLRAWTPVALYADIEAYYSKVLSDGGKIDGASQPPSSKVQERDENGTPVVDPEGKPVMTSLPEGVGVYTIRSLAHGKTQSGKDVLKIFTIEDGAGISKKYGVNCFHAPEQYLDFKTWPIDVVYGVNPSLTHVVIRAPKGESKYADVVEFRP